MPYIETSAKANSNVDEIFESLTRSNIDEEKKRASPVIAQPPQPVKPAPLALSDPAKTDNKPHRLCSIL